MRAHRPVVMSRRGLVVAGNQQAADAGADVLRAGGNAMDAAVAASAALAVSMPHMCGLGGDAFALWYDAAGGRISVINGSGAAPGAASPARYRDRGLAAVPTRGPLSISVPGLVDAWDLAQSRFGTKRLADVLTGAIELAEAGSLLDRHLCAVLNGPVYAELGARCPGLIELFGPAGGRRLGEALRQPLLARTLREIAAAGGASFYRGPLAAGITRDLAAAGCLLDGSDLAGHRSLVQAPVVSTVRSRRLYSCPPNTQGLVLSLLLGLIEEAHLDAGDADFLPGLLRAKRIAVTEANRLLGDPGLRELPAGLLEPSRLAALWHEPPPSLATADPVAAGRGDTTCVVAVDAAGNAVSWVQSLFDEFGSGVVSLQTGIVLQNRLSLARLQPDLPATLAPRRRCPHTLCPALLVGEDGLLAVATPGGHGQPQTIAQVILALLDLGLDVQEAVEAPRVCQEHDSEVMVESRLDPAALEALRAAGWRLADVGPWSYGAGLVNALGGAMLIAARADGVRLGGADPRRDTYAVAQ